MTRLIDADALKEKEFLTYQNNGVEIEEIMVVPVGAIDNAPTVEPKQGEWIPCSERLPEEGGFYLVTFKTYGNGRGVIEKFYRKTENLWTDDGVHRGFFLNPDEVTAWMPLPEPYKEGEP